MAAQLQIGQVARVTGISVDAIRFYETQKLLKRPIRTAGGFRLFGAQDVENIQFIRRAQELGFSLKEIRELLFLQGEKVEACLHVRDLLDAKLRTVRQKIAELHKLEHQLALDSKKCDRKLRSTRPAGGYECCPVLQEMAQANPHREVRAK